MHPERTTKKRVKKQNALRAKQENTVLLDLKLVLHVKQENTVLLDLQPVLNVKEENSVQQDQPNVLVSKLLNRSFVNLLLFCIHYKT